MLPGSNTNYAHVKHKAFEAFILMQQSYQIPGIVERWVALQVIDYAKSLPWGFGVTIDNNWNAFRIENWLPSRQWLSSDQLVLHRFRKSQPPSSQKKKITIRLIGLFDLTFIPRISGYFWQCRRPHLWCRLLRSFLYLSFFINVPMDSLGKKKKGHWNCHFFWQTFLSSCHDSQLASTTYP